MMDTDDVPTASNHIVAKIIECLTGVNDPATNHRYEMLLQSLEKQPQFAESLVQIIISSQCTANVRYGAISSPKPHARSFHLHSFTRMSLIQSKQPPTNRLSSFAFDDLRFILLAVSIFFIHFTLRHFIPFFPL
jgi:hypothetical protein